MSRTKRKIEDEVYADGAWIWTNSGKKFSYSNTRADQICIEDIAAGLSKMCRYAGQIDIMYTVADHCINIVQKAAADDHPPHVLLGLLLHDASEAYLPDIPSPAKSVLPGFRDLEHKIYGVIAHKFGAPQLTDEEFAEILEYYDKRIVVDEALEFFNQIPTWVEGRPFLDITPATFCNPEREYLELFWELMDECGNDYCRSL